MAAQQSKHPPGKAPAKAVIIKPVALNKRARHEFELVDTFEAGLALEGTEVKSLRDGKAQITEAWVKVAPTEAWLYDAHINPYACGTHGNHALDRPRKLLLNRNELLKLHRAVKEKGLTVVATRLYFKGPWAKVEIATARGKKLHDKREDLRKRQDQREQQAAKRR